MLNVSIRNMSMVAGILLHLNSIDPFYQNFKPVNRRLAKMSNSYDRHIAGISFRKIINYRLEFGQKTLNWTVAIEPNEDTTVSGLSK